MTGAKSADKRAGTAARTKSGTRYVGRAIRNKHERIEKAKIKSRYAKTVKQNAELLTVPKYYEKLFQRETVQAPATSARVERQQRDAQRALDKELGLGSESDAGSDSGSDSDDERGFSASLDQPVDGSASDSGSDSEGDSESNVPPKSVQELPEIGRSLHVSRPAATADQPAKLARQEKPKQKHQRKHKADAFAKALKTKKSQKAAKTEAALAAEKAAKDRAAERAECREKRQRTHKRLAKRTARGQPFLSNQIDQMLRQIRASGR